MSHRLGCLVVVMIMGSLGACGPVDDVRDDDGTLVIVDMPMTDNTQDPTPPPPPPAPGDLETLTVDIGPDIVMDMPAPVELLAEVSGADPEGRLFYSWSFSTALGHVIGEGAFAFDQASTTLDPEALLDGATLAGGITLTVTLEVRELRDGVARAADDTLQVIIAGGDPPADGDEPVLPDDGDDADTEEPPDEDVEDDLLPDDGADVIVDLPGNGDGGILPGNPCDGSNAFTMVLPSDLHMSLFEGSRTLQPIVCNGVAPFTYAWTPIELLQDGGGALDSPSGLVDTLDVDFQPTAVGDYSVTLVVTDSTGAEAVGTIRIHVHDFDPLIANAGADQAVPIGTPLTIMGSAMGGSGSYQYAWLPVGGTGQAFVVPTDTMGQTVYTLQVTDAQSGAVATSTVDVVVTAAPAPGCVDADVPTGFNATRFVAFDSAFGTSGQAVVANGNAVALIELPAGTIRATMPIPSDATALVIDELRRRAYVATRLTGAFTRSVQIVDLDSATLGANIGLVDTVAAARGMDVIPSTGHVLVAVSGAISGVIQVDPVGAAINSALLNMHHTNSFSQPIDVAVVESGAWAVAAVANASDPSVTLVPLSAITFDPTMPPGGGALGPLSRATTYAAPRAIAPDGVSGRLAVAMNSGGQGRVQNLRLTGNTSATPGTTTILPATVSDLALSTDGNGQAFVAVGSAGAAAVLLDFSIVGDSFGIGQTVLDVAASSGAVLIVGNGTTLAQRCP